MPRVLFPLAGITDSPVGKIQNESKITVEFRVILAPSPLILILILPLVVSKSLFFFEIIREMFFEHSLTEFTLASSKICIWWVNLAHFV